MNWYLADNRLLRFSSFTLLYIAQGLPIGLISIALPAWLAEQGAAPSQIASFIAISGLPWGFKLLAGPVMDRFSFLAMGRRRPWIVGAQLGLVVSMALMSLVPDPVNNMVWLTVVAFVINFFSALQDVAVDGMAIDTLPTDERGRANSFMAFGQVAGYSLSAATSAALLASFGVAGASLALTTGIALIFLWAVLVRERRGEKLLPWTAGVASARSILLQAENWQSIFRDLNKVIFLRSSLLLMLVALGWRIADGFWLVAAPVIVVQDLNFASTDYSYWTSVFGATAAVLGLLLGPVIDRLGARLVFVVSLTGMGIVYLFAGGMTAYWGSAYFLLSILFVLALLSQGVFISFIALHMNICWNKVSATQFAIYMAWSNLARSIGASIYGEVKPGLDQGQEFYIMGFCVLAAAGILMLVNLRQHLATLEKLDSATLDS